MDFIIFILATLGLTFILTQSFLFKKFRIWLENKNKNLGKLINCTMCSGVYCSIIVYLLIMFKITIIVYAFAGSFICYAVWLLLKGYMNKFD